MTLLQLGSGLPAFPFHGGLRKEDGIDKSPQRATCSRIAPQKTTEGFLLEVQDAFLSPVNPEGIMRISNGMMTQFRERLQTDPACMLPSYHHKLATGKERGRYVALDLGGSTFRVAIIELDGRDESTGESRSRIIDMRAFRVGVMVKELVGTAFFDWMAARIIETLEGKGYALTTDRLDTLPLALTWSFPVEQTSPSSGRLQAMGKAFRAADGLMGQDLGSLVEEACLRAGFTATIQVLLNDSGATLISQTYTHPSTRFGLILGTGVNMAGHMPLSLIGSAKFGERPAYWFEEARSVVVNAEMSMFGQGVLPQTRWDTMLSQALLRPDFQPLETLASGMYLGEIFRLVLIEATETTGVFGGIVPKAFAKPYSLGTELLSMIESNDFDRFQIAVQESSSGGNEPYILTEADRECLRSLAAIISQRSAAVVAASIHAFWELRREALHDIAASAATKEERKAAEMEASLEDTTIAFTGSVIENYPGYLEACEKLVENLRDGGAKGRTGEAVAKIKFVRAVESSLFGAAVALAAAMGDGS